MITWRRWFLILVLAATQLNQIDFLDRLSRNDLFDEQVVIILIIIAIYFRVENKTIERMSIQV